MYLIVIHRKVRTKAEVAQIVSAGFQDILNPSEDLVGMNIAGGRYVLRIQYTEMVNGPKGPTEGTVEATPVQRTGHRHSMLQQAGM